MLVVLYARRRTGLAAAVSPGPNVSRPPTHRGRPTAEYDALPEVERTAAPAISSRRGSGRVGAERPTCFRCRHADPDHVPFLDDDDDEVLAARAKVEALLIGLDPLGDEALARLACAIAAVEAIEEFDVHPEALRHDLDCQWSFRERDREHLDGCADPECDAGVCRLARGETQEEIDADLKAEREARSARARGKAGTRGKPTTVKAPRPIRAVRPGPTTRRPPKPIRAVNGLATNGKAVRLTGAN